MAEQHPPQDARPDEEGYFEIDPEGPDALDLIKAAAADAAEGIAPDASPQDASDDGSGGATDLETVCAERDDFQQQFLRVSADYQNFARRTQQNIASASEQAKMEMARALVTVLDHFDRALEAANTQGEDSDLLQGMTMVKDELLSTLGRFGIARMDVEIGEEFDPNRHEALMRQPSDQVESNHITLQMLPGYTLGEKIVRPAQVGVAE